MQSVGTRDTGPELAVRQFVHGLGVRYRLHARDLPGSPDIVLPAQHKAIFVHGCFWHGHSYRWGRLPKSRVKYWSDKVAGNRRRDRRVRVALRRQGWQTMVVWQCELRDPARVLLRLVGFLERA